MAGDFQGSGIFQSDCSGWIDSRKVTFLQLITVTVSVMRGPIASPVD